jgi:hypothetical protein
MGKSSFFTGQPVFNQLLSFIPAALVSRLSKKYKADYYVKRFTASDHLVSMLFCAFHRCTSIRELITGLQANSNRLFHMRLTTTPRRSTLSDANKRRPEGFFQELFHQLFKIHYGVLPDSLKGETLFKRLFVIDSTTFTMFCDVLKGAGVYGHNGRKKGGAKAHVMMRVEDQVPSFVHLTEAASSDKILMPLVTVPSRAVLIMDMAYVNYKLMAAWSDQKIDWVTRLHPWLRFQVTQQRKVKEIHRKRGVRRDQTILLGNPATQSRNPLQVARLVTYYDRSSKREFTFLTNNQTFSPLTIAQIYKQRWNVETMFRGIKQSFQFHNFLGDNQNAIKIQLWCTLIAHLLVSIVRDKVNKLRKRKWSLANITGMIRQHLTTYIHLIGFLLDPDKALIGYQHPNPREQLLLFKT